MASISALSKELRIARNTLRARISEGWSIEQIKAFYAKNHRHHRPANSYTTEDIQKQIEEIESTLADDFKSIVYRIIEYNDKKSEICKSLNLTQKQFEIALGLKFTPAEIVKLNLR